MWTLFKNGEAYLGYPLDTKAYVEGMAATVAELSPQHTWEVRWVES
jgi:hypothetical protein